MFRELIGDPIAPLTRNYIRTLTRPTNEYDYALTCLGVALFKDRIEDYKGIGGRCGTYGPDSIEVLLNLAAEDCSTQNPQFYYIVTQGSCFGTAQEIVRKLDLQELPAVNKYIESQLQMNSFAAYKFKDRNTAVVLSCTSDMRVYHLCCAFIYTLFQEIFKDKPLTQDETKILKSICNKSSTNFTTLLSQALAPMKESLLRTELVQCFAGFRQEKINAAKRKMDEMRNNCEDCYEQYCRSVDMLNNQIVIYEGLRTVYSDGNNDQEKEAVDYVCGCNHIHNVNFSDGYLTFQVDTILTNTDPMKFQSAIRSKDIYNNYRLEDDNPFNNKAHRTLFMNALFKETNPELFVRIRGEIKLNPGRQWMDAPRNAYFDDNDAVLGNCLTNPHFKFHGCPGQNRTEITKCLQDGDIVSAIECSIAATGSVNIGETDITFRPFVNEILSSKKKIIQRADGELMTPTEALLWLIQKQGESVA